MLTKILPILIALGLAGCANALPDAKEIDTYCRDTFYWTTSPKDTEETKAQADKHNSRRLCRCESDCN